MTGLPSPSTLLGVPDSGYDLLRERLFDLSPLSHAKLACHRYYAQSYFYTKSEVGDDTRLSPPLKYYRPYPIGGRESFIVPAWVVKGIVTRSCALTGRARRRCDQGGCSTVRYMFLSLCVSVNVDALAVFLEAKYVPDDLDKILRRYEPTGICECCGAFDRLVMHHWFDVHSMGIRETRMVCSSCNTLLSYVKIKENRRWRYIRLPDHTVLPANVDLDHVLPDWEMQKKWVFYRKALDKVT